MWRLTSSRKQKIFCIGRNKTGTTSIEFVLKEFGFKVGNQVKAELLIHDYAQRNWKPIIDLCKTAQAFQDVPFSWPETWRELEKVYPTAKFILTYRDPEKWYNSITTAHSKLLAKGKRTPTLNDLQNAEYRYKGYFQDMVRIVYATPADDPYNKKIFLDNYTKYNTEVLSYFAEKTNFLAIDVSQKDSYALFCSFLGMKPKHTEFPHINKTSDL